MSNLIERTTIDRIEVLPETLHIQIRQRLSVIRVTETLNENGTSSTNEEEISYKFNRYVLEPNCDLSEQPDNVVAIAKATWGITDSDEEQSEAEALM